MKPSTKKTASPDSWLFFTVISLVVLGILVVFDASFARASDKAMGNGWFFVNRQIFYATLGVVAMFIAMRLHPRVYKKMMWAFVGISILLLVVVMIPGVGKSIGGAARWIAIGPFHLQPSEFAKLAVIMYLSDVLTRPKTRVRNLARMVWPHFALIGLIAGLVFLEPDMGTTGTIVFTTAALLFVAGARKRHLFSIAAIGGLLAAIVVKIEPYRFERITVWLDPWKDYSGSGYQIIHALIGLGTGGFAGMGLAEGREKYYIPAPQTDMIATTIGEEVGFIGMMILMALFIVFVYRGLQIAHRAKCPYMSLLAVGLTTLIGVQALMNVAVVCAAIPMTGVPLPFISYGGSYLIAMLFGAGMLLSISRHQDDLVVKQKSGTNESSNHGRGNGRTYISCTEYRPTTKRVKRRSSVRR